MTSTPTTVCRLRVNGDVRECAVTANSTLLEALRYGLGLTGSKQGCDKGDCGACTVVADGVAVLACISLVLAYHDGPAITTIEGVAARGAPHPLQDAFDRTGAAQCGFCTPGILMSAWALLAREKQPSRETIARALSGNLCRCTGYTKIFEAVELAAAELRAGEASRASAAPAPSAVTGTRGTGS
ncbi:MAG TPA: (2Fe-2S)-binding protein [Candidatus Limnocylindria bacterium]|nr:(2Fe-2S)-binding protein [Candidatus Limnocylindria bacterium]